MTDDKSLTPAPDAALPSVRTFASVLDAAKIPAKLKRELLALYHADLHRTRDEAEARCLSPDLLGVVRELVDGAVTITRAETLGDVAQELQRFGTETEHAAKEAAADAREQLAFALDRIPHALAREAVGTRERRLRELRNADRLPADDPDRTVGMGPCPLGALRKRARESGVTVTRTTDDEVDR